MAGTVAEVTASAADFALTETFAQFGKARVEVERVAAQDDRIIPFVWVSHENIEAVHQALEGDATTANIEVLTDLDGERLYRMEWVDRIDALVYVLVEENGTVLSASAENGRWVLRLLFADREALGRTYDHCRDVGLDLSIKRVFDLNEGRQGRFGLTEKQQDVLEVAFEQGYYSIPRDAAAQDLAEEMGTSHQALSERLRRAHETLVESTVVLGRGSDKDHE
jgi:predicted DNA binding protein